MKAVKILVRVGIIIAIIRIRINELIGLKDYKGLPVFICFSLVKHQKIRDNTLPLCSKSNDLIISPSVVKLAWICIDEEPFFSPKFFRHNYLLVPRKNSAEYISKNILFLLKLNLKRWVHGFYSITRCQILRVWGPKRSLLSWSMI